MPSLVCFSCQKSYDYIEKVSLREECPSCSADGHVCLNCEFYDAKAYNECREPQAERVAVKDRNNRCDYFGPRQKNGFGLDTKKNDLQAAAEALFKKNK